MSKINFQVVLFVSLLNSLCEIKLNFLPQIEFLLQSYKQNFYSILFVRYFIAVTYAHRLKTFFCTPYEPTHMYKSTSITAKHSMRPTV